MSEQIHKKSCGHYPIVAILRGDNLISGITEIDVCKDCKKLDCFIDFEVITEGKQRGNKFAEIEE